MKTTYIKLQTKKGRVVSFIKVICQVLSANWFEENTNGVTGVVLV